MGLAVGCADDVYKIVNRPKTSVEPAAKISKRSLAVAGLVDVFLVAFLLTRSLEFGIKSSLRPSEI